MEENPLRTATIVRETSESKVSVEVNLDGTGKAEINTPVGFLKHMLNQIARHGLIDLKVEADGDLETGSHHTVEDTAIVFGRAVREAVGDGQGIIRMGHVYVPLDETLAFVALDIGGRPYAVVRIGLSDEQVGDLPGDLVRHFLETFALEARIAVHARIVEGSNPHHKAEALFKGLARALREAVTVDPRASEQVPSTKGTLNN